MNDRNPTRRQWLTALLRSSVLAVLGAGTVLLARRSSGARGSCTQRLPCERCGSRDGCQLPQAVAWRER